MIRRCFLCGHRHKPSLKMVRAAKWHEAAKKCGIVDERRNQKSIHGSTKDEAHERAKSNAWYAVGLSSTAAYRMAQLSWTPKDIPKFTDEELLGVIGVGQIVLARLRGLTADAEDVWQERYRESKAFWSERLKATP